MADKILEKIAQRAYNIWKETGSADQFRNWVQAEYDMHLQFSDQKIADHAHFIRHSDADPKKSDDHYWFEALNELRMMHYRAHSEEGIAERELFNSQALREREDSDDEYGVEYSEEYSDEEL